MRTSHILLILGLASATVALGQTTNVGHSIMEWSTTQGVNGWNYGYYNRTLDGDATYSGTEFTALPGSYALGGNPPWTGINQADGHPNQNGAGEHWIIRRYTVGAGEGGGAIDIKWNMSKANTTCGDGVSGFIFHNGTQIDTAYIPFNSGTGVNRFTTVASASTGDTIDILIAPGANDGCDSTLFGMQMNRRNTYTGLITTQIADSGIAEFGQNTNGWTYGIYDITANGSPGPGEFVPFENGAWNGSMWDKFGGDGAPWTEVTATGGHPNLGSGNEEWATRRYTIQPGEAGDTLIEYNVSKSNTGGGGGVSAHILVNGITLASTGVTGNDGTGWTGSLLVPNLQVGDTIDLLLDPHGTDVRLLGSGDNTDGADGSNFGMRIFNAVPEPSSFLLLTVAGLALLRRRK